MRGLYIGKTSKWRMPSFLRYNHLRDHVLLLGPTMSGRPQLLNTMLHSVVSQGGGCILVKPGSDTEMVHGLHDSCQSYGRGQDLHVLDFDNHSVSLGSRLSKDSDGLDIFPLMDHRKLRDLLWSMLLANGNVNSSDYMVRRALLDLVQTAFTEHGGNLSVIDLMDNLKSHNLSAAGDALHETVSPCIAMLLNEYNHIFNPSHGGDLNLEDGILNNKVIMVNLPELYGDGGNTRAMAVYIQRAITNAYENLLKSKERQSSKVPFLIIFDSFSHYMEPKMITDTLASCYDYGTPVVLADESRSYIQEVNPKSAALALANTECRIWLRRGGMEGDFLSELEEGFWVHKDSSEHFTLDSESGLTPGRTAKYRNG